VRSDPGKLVAINTVAATTGNDTPLGTLILQLHTETACRCAAALYLTPADVDAQWCLLRLQEKNDTMTEPSHSLDARVAALETQVNQLTQQVQRSAQDAAAARVMASRADRDVDQIRGDFRDFRDATTASSTPCART
jgi:outer membrane murein-binding lipoprotein Lpp